MTSERGKSDFLELVKSGRAGSGQPQRLLALVQRQLLDHCQRTTESLFRASDDAFYDFAQRAGSNNEENLYFEAMRKVRLAQQPISQAFARNLKANFEQFTRGASRADKSAPAAISANNLTMVEGDELEVDLALKNMTTRARDKHREALYELDVRFDALAQQGGRPHPLAPSKISEAFISAADANLDIPVNARLILFKLFEQHLLKQLGPLYDQVNRTLADAGVVPKVGRHLRKDNDCSSSEPDAVEAEAPVPMQSSGRESAPQPLRRGHQHARFNMTLDTLLPLMSAVRRTPPARLPEQNSTVVNCYIFTQGNPGPLMSGLQLSSLLTRTQLVADRQLSQRPRNLVPDLVDKLLRKGNAKAPQTLAETDEAVINLVSLFFDQTLADDNLPTAIYALVCRLQIPVLKIALQDSSFFSRHDHPARRLINTITEFGLGLNEHRPLERDPVYRKMLDSVETIARAQSVDEPLFEQLHKDIKTLIDAEKRRSAVVERRTSQSALGRSRIRHARRYSQNLLYSKLHGVQLPAAVHKFLATAWLQVMIITHLKHGHESEEWDTRGETAEDLVWLCQRHRNVRSLLRREQLQPLVLERLEEGLEAAVDSPQVRQAHMADLVEVLEQIQAGADLECTYLSREQKEALGQVESLDQARHDVSVEGHRDGREQAPYEYLEKARTLPEGSWVEYANPKTGMKSRYKLATKADADSYVFVDRMGFRTLERSCKQLAHDMRSHRIRPLPASEFFDRMMNKVLSRISQAA